MPNPQSLVKWRILIPYHPNVDYGGGGGGSTTTTPTISINSAVSFDVIQLNLMNINTILISLRFTNRL